MPDRLLTRFPVARWLRDYQRADFSADLIAGMVVTVLLIPQSLAYAMLAGLPPEVGLYASVLPLLVYALLGSSRSLSVGPVAVISLMTATALGDIAAGDSALYLTGAITLALMSGLMLIFMGWLKAGFMANFLSHTVISGFITASGILIAFSQLKHILGVEGGGNNVLDIGTSLIQGIANTNSWTVAIGLAVILFLYWSRSALSPLLKRMGMSLAVVDAISKAAPIAAVLGSIAVVYGFGLAQKSVALVGEIPSGLPRLHWILPDWALCEQLLFPAAMIAMIGYVESVSVGKTLAAKRRLRVDPNQELVALGAANVASGLSGAFPVSGGFSRSVVNFDAGASTQMASVIAAFGIALASVFLTPFLYYLPKATLAATIVVAVLSLVDVAILKHTWRYCRGDFSAVFITIVVTLLLGVEVGVCCGVLVTIVLFLYRSSRPHIAEVGLIEGTEHFRNVNRHQVTTCPNVLVLRPDESLYFANVAYLEALIYRRVSERPKLAHIVIMCSAINDIDFSALEVLESLNMRLQEQGLHLHLSEVKGPVMDRLKRSDFLAALSGQVFLSQYACFQALFNEMSAKEF